MSISRHGSVIEPTDFRVAKDMGGLYEGYVCYLRVSGL
jgi:hypothetical protein